MATDIVQSLFGPSPYDIQRAQRAEMDNTAWRYAKAAPFEAARAGLFSAAGGLAGAGAEALGMVNPQVEQARATEQAMAGIDPSNPDAIFQRAQQVQDPRLKMRLTQYAQQMKAQQQKAAYKKAMEMKSLATAERELSVAEKNARDPKQVAPPTRTYQKGEKSVTEELQPDGSWKELGSGPKFSKSVINVNGIDQGKESFDPSVVDFYATQALMTGDQSWRVGLGRSKDGVKLILAVDKRVPALAKEVGMTAEEASNNKQMFASRLKAIKDFGTGIQGRQVTSFNTAIDHLDTLQELAVALKNNNMQAANSIAQTVSAWTGGSAPTNFDSAKQIIAEEIVKSIVPGGGGVTERMELADKIKRSSSPAQLEEGIKTFQKLMAGQLRSLEQQYKQTTQRKDFREKLLPRSVKVLESIGRDASGASPPPAKPKFLGFEEAK